MVSLTPWSRYWCLYRCTRELTWTNCSCHRPSGLSATWTKMSRVGTIPRALQWPSKWIFMRERGWKPSGGLNSLWRTVFAGDQCPMHFDDGTNPWVQNEAYVKTFRFGSGPRPLASVTVLLCLLLSSSLLHWLSRATDNRNDSIHWSCAEVSMSKWKPLLFLKFLFFIIFIMFILKSFERSEWFNKMLF